MDTDNSSSGGGMRLAIFIFHIICSVVGTVFIASISEGQEMFIAIATGVLGILVSIGGMYLLERKKALLGTLLFISVYPILVIGTLLATNWS